MSARHNLAKKQKPAPARTNFVGLGAAIMALVAIVAVAIWALRSQFAVTRPLAEPAETTIKDPVAAPPGPASGFRAVLGRWQRPDGGYVLQITNVDESGKLDASYFNPNPIHVSRAQALRDGPALKILVELRDVNYPGSTYALAHDPADDQLKGIYYQAALRQQFEVVFDRLK